MYKKFILLTYLILILGLATVQAQDSYIIVHVLNPEGVEIGTIEDLYQNIEIYDGANFIGYAPHNEESHNVPIEIGPGTHTIKVEFNGMTKEQVIELNPGQTKNIVFNFERSEFDLAGYLDSVGGTGNINLSEEVTWISELSDEQYEQDEPFGLTLGYTALFTKSQPSFIVTWKVEGSAQSVFNSQNFRLHASLRSQIVEATNCGGTVCLWVESEGEIYSSGLNIPISTDFNDWFVQYIQDGWWPIITVGTSSPPYYVGNPIPGIRGTDPPSGLYPDSGYHCHKLPSNENYTGMGIIWLYSDQGDYVEVVLVFGDNRVETIASNLNPSPPEREFTFEGTLQGLTMSSVPYDLLGTGIHCDGVGPQPPENQPPVASTSPATDVTKSSATLNGILTDDGGEACQYRFRYRDEKSDYIYTPWIGSKTTGELFSQPISDLRHNRTYYFSAKAKNSAGESTWGNEQSFATLKPKEFMITFDDGPIFGQTDSILLQLMNCRVDGKPVRAAFFMVGDPDPLYYAWYDLEWNKGSVQQYPAAARRVAGFGHSVGNHTQHHAWFPQWWVPDFGFKSMEDFVADEVSKCNTALENALRENPTEIFRAPYLQEKEYPSEIQKGVKKSKLNLKIVSGEIADISDLVFPPPTVTDVQNKARGILESWGEDEPVVLIFHDNRSVTYNHIGEIITYLQNEGYRLVHFDCDDIPQQTMGD